MPRSKLPRLGPGPPTSATTIRLLVEGLILLLLLLVWGGIEINGQAGKEWPSIYIDIAGGLATLAGVAVPILIHRLERILDGAADTAPGCEHGLSGSRRHPRSRFFIAPGERRLKRRCGAENQVSRQGAKLAKVGFLVLDAAG